MKETANVQTRMAIEERTALAGDPPLFQAAIRAHNRVQIVVHRHIECTPRIVHSFSCIVLPLWNG